MRKIKLELESLAVESFETSGTSEERGTVQGAEGFAATNHCIEPTRITGACCDYTLALSCIADNCSQIIPV
jgi:hypothetical protein